MCWTVFMQPYFYLPVDQGLFTEASIIATPEEATILFNKQQGNELYIKRVLQDATYFLLLFLEWVCPLSGQALLLVRRIPHAMRC